MPTYAYRALSQEGQSSEGTVVAGTRREALQRLLTGGQHVLDLREEKARAPGQWLGLRLGRRRVRLSAMARQLATLCASGVPLVQSLNVLIEQAEDPRARRILSEIRESVRGGSTLAEALARHPGTFPRVMVGMVRVGEVGGSLDDILAQLSELFEKEESLRSEVRAAMAYPLLVLFLGLGAAVVLIVVLIPRLASLFEGFGRTLPAPTRVLIWLSGALGQHGLVLVLAAAVVVAGVRLVLRYPAARLLLDRAKLRIPWLGRLIRNAAIARFARLLGTVTRGGVSVVEGLDIVEAAVGNRVMANAIREMARRVRRGESLASLMKGSAVFPALPVQMVAVGEETGHLDQMLLRVAEAYERETATSTRVMTSLLAPIMLLAVAGVVGFIILAMLLPIFQLSTVVR